MCELCYHEHESKEYCIFVGEPCDLIKDYKKQAKSDADYMDYA